MKNKIKRFLRITAGVIIGLIVFVVVGKITIFFVGVIGSLGLGTIGIDVSESERALANLGATANILGFFVGVIVAGKVVQKIVRKQQQAIGVTPPL